MRKPANILFVSLYTDMGGNEIALLNLVKSLDRTRFTPVMMFNRRGAFTDQAEAAGVATVLAPYESVMLQRLIHPGICWANMKASKEIYTILKSSKIDIVQCSDVLSLLLIAIPVLRLRIPVVYSVVFYYEWLRVILFNVLALLIVDSIVAASHMLKRDLSARSVLLNKKLSVIHSGVDTALFHPPAEGEQNILREELRLTPSTKIIGMAARFDPVKGHATFLRAASMLLERRKDLRFVIVGGLLMSDALPAWKAYHEEIMRLYRESAIGDNATFISHRDDIALVMRGLDLLVCPSDHEGFGLVVPEALVSGVPVVVSRSVGALEAVQDEPGVVIAEPGDAPSFVRGIDQALDISSSQNGSFRPSESFLRRIAWQNTATQFQRTYEYVCA